MCVIRYCVLIDKAVFILGLNVFQIWRPFLQVGSKLPHGKFIHVLKLPHGKFIYVLTLPHGKFIYVLTLPHGKFIYVLRLPHGTFVSSFMS